MESGLGIGNIAVLGISLYIFYFIIIEVSLFGDCLSIGKFI